MSCEISIARTGLVVHSRPFIVGVCIPRERATSREVVG